MTEQKPAIEERVGRVLASWVDATARHPISVLLGVVIASAGIGFYTVGNLGVDADENRMFSSALPHRIYELQYHQSFPLLEENILIVVEAAAPEEAGQAAAELAGRMRNRTELFRSVYRPRGAFFEQHALLYLDVEELEDFADRLARFQPYLAALANDGTLRGLSLLMARGVRAVGDGDVAPQDIVPMLERFARASQALRTGESFRLSWEEVIAGRELETHARRRIILAQPVLDFDDIAPARRSIAAVKAIARELRLEERGVSVRLTGAQAMATEEMSLVEEQARAAGLASFVLVAGILWLALRSLRFVFAAITTLVVGLIWTAGFAAVAVGHLNLISVSFAVLFIGLGIDFAVHLCLRYQELVGLSLSHVEALRETARGVGSSLVLCAFTTAIGFYAFVPTDFAGVAELGLIAGTGMFISLACTFTVLPPLLSLRLPGRVLLPARVRMLRLPDFPVRHPKAVSAAALALSAAAVLVLPAVHFDVNPLRVRDPAAESVQVMEEMLETSGAPPWELNTLAPNPQAAERLAARLAKLPVVDQAITVRDYVPSDQLEKLAIIEDVALFLAPPPDPSIAAEPPTTTEQLEALGELGRQLEAWPRLGPGADSLPLVQRVHQELSLLQESLALSPAPALALHALEDSLLGSLPAELRHLDAALRARRITVEGLPVELLERMVSARGEVRVRILPAEDLSDNAALARFVNGVRSVTPDVQGAAVSIFEAGRTVVRALREAFAAALVVIALLLFLIWRTIGDTALVLVPLGLAAVFTAAATVLVGIPLNFADVIVLPLLLGIGVDSGIHLVHRSHMLPGEPERLLETSTARAVVFSSITTIASFGSLAFASHRGMASLGQLLALGVLITVLCNLFVLPALIQLRAGRLSLRSQGRRSSGPR